MLSIVQRFLLTIPIFCSFLLPAPLIGQEELPVVIRVSRSVPVVPARIETSYVNGYHHAIDGAVLPYRSSHPDAEEALLVRARKDVHAVTWESDTLPRIPADKFHYLIWLAGLERAGFPDSKESYRFHLFIDGKRWFTFRNRKDLTAFQWTERGPDGAELSFRTSMIDRVGDLFGYMVLKIPATAVSPGAPLRLRVEGEDAGSADWYMTFKYRFQFSPRFRAEPALLRSSQGPRQLLRLSLDNLTTGRGIRAEFPGMPPIEKELAVGANVFMLPVDEMKSPRTVRIRFQNEEARSTEYTVTLNPVVHRDVYLLPYSHNDIGYTDLQPEIERKQWRNLEEALRLIEATRNNPPEAQFRWNLEVIWALESWLGKATTRQKSEFFRAVRDGHIGLNALYANVQTGLANAVEMNRLTSFARTLSSAQSVPVTTAVVSDIPGFTWGIVSALAQSGVKYFSSAPNPGDRTGHIYEALGDKPFYWKSQSGKERVLFWLAGPSYAMFHEGDISKIGEEKLFKLLRRYDESSYPYGIVQLPYTIGGDNGPPDRDLAAFVRRWNERYISPRLIISTHAQMFGDFEARYGSGLPERGGDFTPIWEDGCISTASETALNRRSVDRLIQAEKIWSVVNPAGFPHERFEAAWRNVVLWDEHTWGAHNSVSEPDLPSVQAQWKIKQRFALDADSLSALLLASVCENRRGMIQDAAAFDVFNTQARPRTDLVTLTREQSAIGDLVVDDRGAEVVSQRLSDGGLAFVARDVPAMGARRYIVKKGAPLSHGSARAGSSRIGMKELTVEIDTATGEIRSIRWEGKELVDGTNGAGFNRYWYVAGTDPADARSLRNIRVQARERGPLVASLLIEADAPGCDGYRSEVRIVDGIPRVEMVNRLDKKAVREKEGVHISFPFGIPGGRIRYDVANGIVRPGKDQLDGACMNFFSVQSWLDVSNDTIGVTWSTPDAFLVELGAINAEKPWMRDIEPTQTIYSYVMNNYWHTNFKADQEGPVSFRYSIMPHRAYDPLAAVRFGWEQRQPLLALPCDPGSPISAPLFSFDPAVVHVYAVTPLRDESGWLLHLYNPSPNPVRARLEWNREIPVRMRRSDPNGFSGNEIQAELSFTGYESCFVRVERR